MPRVERLPYFPEQAIEVLSDIDALLLVGATPPVSFFGYPGVPSRLESEGSLFPFVATGEDTLTALDSLADALDAPATAEPAPDAAPPDRPTGALTPAGLGAALARLQPEGAIVVDEGATSGLPYYVAAESAPPLPLLRSWKKQRTSAWRSASSSMIERELSFDPSSTRISSFS